MNAAIVDQSSRRAARTTVFERTPASATAVAHSLADSTAAAFWLDDVLGRRVCSRPA